MGAIDSQQQSGIVAEPLEIAVVIDGFELVQSVGLTVRTGVIFAAAILISTLVLGIMPQYGSKTVSTSRRSPFISILVGVPSALVLGGLTYTGLLISGTNIGVFFAIPLIVLGALLFPTWTALGFTAIGGAIATRVGLEGHGYFVLIGGVTAAMAVVFPPVGIVLTAIATSLGVGAGVRSAIAGGSVTHSSDRVVPPANEV